MTNPHDTTTETACRSCGCTDDAACWPICSWSEPDLCNQCSEVVTHGIPEALDHLAIPMRSLLPHPQRARIRDQIAAGVLRESLQTFGQYRPVITRVLGQVAESSVFEVLAGHGIVEEAAQLGWNCVAVVVHHGIDDETAARIVAVDNRSADLGGYDPVMLEELLSLIPDLSTTGYFPDDLAELQALNAANGMETFTDADDVPDPPAEPVSQTGDVWLLGPHRLAVGDGTDTRVVAAAVNYQLASMLLTDPPYNVAYEGTNGMTIQGDDQDPEAFAELLAGLFTAAIEHVRSGSPAYVFHADTEGEAFRREFRQAGWLLKQTLVWVKDQFVLGRQDHQWQHEPILYGWAPGAAHPWYGGRTLTTVLDDERDPDSWSKAELVAAMRALRAEDSSVIRADRPRRNDAHPTMKPVALLVELLERSSRAGGLVLDVCAGSGSTLIACHQVGRVAALVEYDARYADVICRRWEEHTGIVPVLERTDDQVSFLGDPCGHSPMIEGCGGCDPGAIELVIQDGSR